MNQRIVTFPAHGKYAVDAMDAEVIQNLGSLQSYFESEATQLIIPSAREIATYLANFKTLIADTSPYSEKGKYIRGETYELLSMLSRIIEILKESEKPYGS